MSDVIEIQVGGCFIVNSLEEACYKFIEITEEGVGRTKILFVFKAKDGSHKQITVRDEDDKIVIYGDPGEMDDFLEYAKSVVGEGKDECG